jgi:hypothetical protein
MAGSMTLAQCIVAAAAADADADLSIQTFGIFYGSNSRLVS